MYTVSATSAPEPRRPGADRGTVRGSPEVGTKGKLDGTRPMQMMGAGSFVLTERHKREYAQLGYTVFEACLPPPLIDTLRGACEELRDEARRQTGPQAQRLTKIIGTTVDAAPFDAYTQLPSLKAAFKELISEECEHGSHLFWTPEQEEYHAGHGVLIEPAESPYCTVWHRDWRDNVSGLPLEEWERVCTDRRYFNQTNLALYSDSCFWIVPGSHLRPDTPEEAKLFPGRPIQLPPDLAALLQEKGSARASPAAIEARCLEYMRSMPGAVQLHLNPGDCCVYRNCLWHAGCYSTTAKRATLHDLPETPEFQRWRVGRFRRSGEAVAAERAGGPKAMANPNFESPAASAGRFPPSEVDVRAAVPTANL